MWRKQEAGKHGIVRFLETVHVCEQEQMLVMTLSACTCPWLAGYKNQSAGQSDRRGESNS